MTFSSFLLASALSVGAFPPVTQTNHANPAPAPVTSVPATSVPLAPATPPVAVKSTALNGCAPSGTVISTSTGCGCDSGCGRPGLLESLRGLFSRKSAADCGCAPAACTPAPAPVIIHHAPKVIHSAPCDPCARPARPSFFDLFRRHKQAAPDCGCGSGTVITPAPGGVITPAPAYHGTPSPAPEPAPAPAPSPLPKAPEIKKLPTSSAPVIPSITPAAAKGETGPTHPFDSSRQHGQQDHAADFSTLTGKLTFVHADGGVWVLRYAGLDTEDANGGSVILAKDRRLSHYRDGDVVRVEGRVLNTKGSSRLGAPLYQADVINLVERASR